MYKCIHMYIYIYIYIYIYWLTSLLMHERAAQIEAQEPAPMPMS